MIKFLLNFLVLTAFNVSALTAYAVADFAIKAKADKGGLISPSGNIKIATGGSVTFAIASRNPAEFELVDVLVNGQSQGPVTTYTFANVVSKQSIQAKFRKKLYTQTVINSDPAFGSFTSTGAVSTPYGKSLKFTAKPAKGYKAVISVDGVIVVQGVVNKPVKYALKIAGQHVIAAFFYSESQPLDMRRVTAAVAAEPIIPATNPGNTNTNTNTQPPVVNHVVEDNVSVAGSDVGSNINPASEIGVRLAWGIPVERANGDPLLISDVVGYEVYFTSEDGSVSDVIAVSGATTLSAVVMVPVAGVYYFAIATLDQNGEKSELSSLIKVSIP